MFILKDMHYSVDYILWPLWSLSLFQDFIYKLYMMTTDKA